MKLRKMLAWLTAMAMLGTAALATGCGAEETSSSKAETSAAETEEAADAADDAEVDELAEDDAESGSVDDETAAYADALAGTLWLGMDTEYNCYAMGFNEEEIVFEADDGSSASGYWGVTAGDPTIYIFDDAELTNQIASIPWSYDVENDVMILNNNVIMAQADNYSFSDAATAMQEMATAAKVQEYLQGTYWVGTDDTSASAISMSSDTLEIIELSQDGTLDQGSFLWSMDYDTLNAYDENYNLLASFGWDISEDGSELQLTSDILRQYDHENNKRVNNPSFPRGNGHISCLAGNCSFFINWQGFLFPCVMLSEISAPVFDLGFISAWEKVSAAAQKISLSSQCCQCRLQPICRTCVAAVFLETSSYRGMPGYLCRYSEHYYHLLLAEEASFSSIAL